MKYLIGLLVFPSLLMAGTTLRQQSFSPAKTDVSVSSMNVAGTATFQSSSTFRSGLGVSGTLQANNAATVVGTLTGISSGTFLSGLGVSGHLQSNGPSTFASSITATYQTTGDVITASSTYAGGFPLNGSAYVLHGTNGKWRMFNQNTGGGIVNPGELTFTKGDDFAAWPLTLAHRTSGGLTGVAAIGHIATPTDPLYTLHVEGGILVGDSGDLGYVMATGSATFMTGIRSGGTLTAAAASQHVGSATFLSSATLIADLGFSGNRTISPITADASDSGFLLISGGGAYGATRGSGVLLTGNEQGNAGLVDVIAGAPSGRVRLIGPDSAVSLQVVTNQVQVGVPATFQSSVTVTSGISVGVGGVANGYFESAASIIVNIDSDNNETDRQFNISKDVSGTGGGGVLLFTVGETGFAAVNGTLVQNGAKGCSLGVMSTSTGALSGCVSSDRRMKTKIAPLSYTSKILDGLIPTSYEWRDGGRGRGKKAGFIAQEVEKVFPQAVVSAGGDLKGVDPNALIAVLVAEVQQLRKRVLVLEKK